MITYTQITGKTTEFKNHPDYAQICRDFDLTFEVIYRNFTEILHTLIVASEDGKYIGFIRAGIYPSTTMARPDQWGFVESRLRSCWIEKIRVKKSHRQQGIGTKLIQKAEQFFRENKHLIPKDSKTNFYVASVHKACEFYVKNGYTMIWTEEHSEDYDYPSVFQTETAQFMAKPMDGVLDSEEDVLHGKDYELSWYSECYLSGAEKLDDEVYCKWVKYVTWEHPMQMLYWLSQRYNLDQLEIIRLKMQKAIDKFGINSDGWDFCNFDLSDEKLEWFQKHFEDVFREFRQRYP